MAKRDRGGRPLKLLLLLWRQRELLGLLVARDLRGRWAGSWLGPGWALLTPLVQLAVLTLVFSAVLHVRFAPSGAMAQGPFALALAWGLFPWIAAQDGLTRAASSLVDGAVLVRRLSIEPALLPAVPVLSALVQVTATLVVVGGLSAFAGWPVAPSVVLCLPVLVVQGALVLGLGGLASVGHAYLRDIAALVSTLLQIGFYLSPIVYSVSVAPESLRDILWLNPMAGLIEAMRAFAFGEAPPWRALAWSTLCAAGAISAAGWAFARAAAELPDLV